MDLKDNGDGTFSYTQPEGKVTVITTFQPLTAQGQPIPSQPSTQPVELKDTCAGCLKDGLCPTHSLSDTSAEAWYHDGVHFCVENRIMEGYTDLTFKPNNTLSRAQLAQILYNLEGHPSVGGSSPFTDVPDDAWCAEAVNWAAAYGIVGGYGDGTFGPNNPITRQQFAVMLWRYALVKDYDITNGGTSTLQTFKDYSKISDYAVPALQWATGLAVIQGRVDGSLDPTGRATRAQTAVMLQRYLGKTH